MVQELGSQCEAAASSRTNKVGMGHRFSFSFLRSDRILKANITLMLIPGWFHGPGCPINLFFCVVIIAMLYLPAHCLLFQNSSLQHNLAVLKVFDILLSREIYSVSSVSLLDNLYEISDRSIHPICLARTPLQAHPTGLDKVSKGIFTRIFRPPHYHGNTWVYSLFLLALAISLSAESYSILTWMECV
ncbi:hypothetical protein F4781DRAFT_210367 [Annulohypoxylon bovei var. microspora]|nr:hypothetical protein F4781DRAFT_210367 [Annulohypoxylon bovei var. microspora]